MCKVFECVNLVRSERTPGRPWGQFPAPFAPRRLKLSADCIVSENQMQCLQMTACERCWNVAFYGHSPGVRELEVANYGYKTR